MTHQGTVRLETERLILRRFSQDDAQAMFENWANDSEVTKYLIWQPHGEISVTRQVLADWVAAYEKPDNYSWAMEIKETGTLIGSIAAVQVREDTRMVHIGYCIGREWWHRGFTSEALRALVRFFFEEVGVYKVESRHDPRNPNSGKVMQKAGLRYEGTLRASDTNNQGICDAAYYGILAEEYFCEEPDRTDRNSNVETLQSLTDLMFHNLKIAMDTSNWNADICGAPAWRYIYHTLHSADKWFINPAARFSEPEPPFHVPGLDWVDSPTDTVLSREVLYGYQEQVRAKIQAYLGGMTDGQLSEVPEGCVSTRLGLALEQFRHMYEHMGVLNGITIAHTGRFPRVVNASAWRSGKLPEGLYDEDVRTFGE